MGKNHGSFGSYVSTIVAPLLILGASLLGVSAINRSVNNREVDAGGYSLISKSHGIAGHTEYVLYNDGSQEVKDYSGIGHRYLGSELDVDSNGDGLVDRIRDNGPEILFNRVRIYTRDYDYGRQKEKFDRADQRLNEYKIMYLSRFRND